VNKTRKTDRRTLYTKMVIKEAYYTLLHNMPQENITVTDICKLAEINRSTFYLHYPYSDAVFDELLNELLESICVETEEYISQKGFKWENFDKIYLKFIDDEKNLFLLKKGMSYAPFLEKFSVTFSELVFPYCSSNSTLPENDLRILLTSLMHSHLSLNIFYSENQFVQSPEQYNALIKQYMFEPCLKAIFSDSSAKNKVFK